MHTRVSRIYDATSWQNDAVTDSSHRSHCNWLICNSCCWSVCNKEERARDEWEKKYDKKEHISSCSFSLSLSLSRSYLTVHPVKQETTTTTVWRQKMATTMFHVRLFWRAKSYPRPYLKVPHPANLEAGQQQLREMHPLWLTYGTTKWRCRCLVQYVVVVVVFWIQLFKSASRYH